MMLMPREQSHPEMLLPGLLRTRNRFYELEERWRPTATAMQRFLDNCRGLTPGLTGCVVWMGPVAHTDSSSSPKFYLNGRQVSLRRMMYMWFVGSLEEEKGRPSEWITTCHKRLCINPLHLRKRIKDPTKKRKRRRRRRSTRKKPHQRKLARPRKKRKVIDTIGLSLDTKTKSSFCLDTTIIGDDPACWAMNG